MSYFPPCSHSKNKIEAELDLSKANLELEADKLDIDKLYELDADKFKFVPTDLYKLNDLVKSDVVKKKDYNAKIKSIEDKISSITNLTTNAALDDKINEVKGEIPNITNLTATATLATVENKISNVSDLVNPAPDYDAEIKDIKDKYFTTSNYNRFTNLNSRKL